MLLESGTSFSTYKIGDSVGKGGMGEVFRATDTTLEREVAIKVLPETFAEDTDRVARFDREAKTLASLNHPNIAQIFGLEKQGDTTAIIMELVEGPTLEDPIAPEEALNIAKQIINALEAAHEKGIVHRDLKPANIKLKDDGTIKVLDFGIAKSIDPQGISGGQTPTQVTPAVTETGIIMGTASYMSPEQARGRFVDQRTDIWAFGCVFFEMLSGQPAFGGEDVAETLARIIALETDFNSLPGMVSPAVRHTIKLCLEKEPKKRISDIRDVRLALSGVFETGQLPMEQSAVAQPLWKKLSPIAASVVITAVVTSLFFLESPEGQQAVEVRRSMLALPAGQSLSIPFIRSIAVAEDDSKLVYAANSALYVRDMDELEPRVLPGTEGGVTMTPLFSPSGDWIAYVTPTGIDRVSTEGGTPLPVITEYPIGGFNWVDDDTIIYSAFEEIWRVTANGGQPELLLTEEEGYTASSPKILPGTDTILYQRTSSDEINEVALASITSGEITTLFPGFIPEYHPEGYLIYFDDSLGLLARAFDINTFEIGSPIAMVNDIFRAQGNLGSPQFNVSNDGSLLYVKGEVSAGGSDFLGIGDENQVIRQLDVPLSTYLWPSVSPDGLQVAIQDGQQIYIYALDGSSEIRQLTRDGSNINPTWSLDGQYITYSSDRDGTRRIWQQRADGSGVAEPLTEGLAGQPQTLPVWAPDGRLTYQAPNEGGEEDIWIVSIPLGEPEVLIGGEGFQGNIDFSVDGLAMAYGSDESGVNQAYVAPFPPDGSSTRVSEAGLISGWPVWSPQGGRLYFSHGSPEGVVRATVLDINVPGFAVTDRRLLPFILSAEGRRLDGIPGSEQLFLALPSAQNTPGGAAVVSTELIIVENWIEEVKQRVPPLE